MQVEGQTRQEGVEGSRVEYQHCWLHQPPGERTRVLVSPGLSVPQVPWCVPPAGEGNPNFSGKVSPGVAPGGNQNPSQKQNQTGHNKETEISDSSPCLVQLVFSVSLLISEPGVCFLRYQSI